MALAVALLAAGPASLAAQRRLELAFALSPTIVRLRSLTPAGRETLSGFGLGGEAVATLRERWSLRLRYSQGRATADSTGVLDRRLAEGELFLGYRATPWLSLWVGPHARSYLSDLGNQRWIFWETRASALGTLVPDRLHSYFEGWIVASGSVKVPQAFESGQGGEAGLSLRLARPDLSLRLGYRIEQARLAAGRRETVEQLMLGVGKTIRR
jgi:hypothetical protein